MLQRLAASSMKIFRVVLRNCQAGDTRSARAAELANVSSIDTRYDVSQKLSRPSDLQRSCWAVSFSIKVMVPPQCGHSQRQRGVGADAICVTECNSGSGFSSCWQRGNKAPRRRFARNPQKRMRTKPGGRVWSRNRRRNSSAVMVIRRCWLWWCNRTTLPSLGGFDFRPVNFGSGVPGGRC